MYRGYQKPQHRWECIKIIANTIYLEIRTLGALQIVTVLEMRQNRKEDSGESGPGTYVLSWTLKD